MLFYEEIKEAIENDAHLVIPDWVTCISKGMFEYVDDIVCVTVPKTVKEIEDFAFYGCGDLETITIPEGVKLGEYAFSGILNLKKIILVHENGTRTIKKWVITRGDDLDPSPDGSIIIPEGVTEIEDYAFSDCTSLKSIVIPESVTQIGDDVFSDCTSLKSINIPEGVTQLGGGLFRGCRSLKSINIPEGVTQIGECAFSGCTSLKSVVIPESVTQIGFNAFHNTSIVQMTGAMLESFKTKCCECGKSINTKKDRCLKIIWSRDGQHRITCACSTCGEELSTRDINNPCAFCDGYDCCSCTVNYEDGMASPDTVESMEWIDN